MIWLNLKTSTLRHPAYVGSEPVQRAAWLNVLSYCAEQENGGRIVGARGWKDRQWQQTCGVMLAEVDAAAPLLTWDGDDLVVWEYPAEKEAEVIGKRAVAQENGRRGGRPKNPPNTKAEANGKPTLVPTSVTENNQHCKAEGKGREEEGERNGNGTTTLPPTSPARMAGSGRCGRIPTTEQSKRIAAMMHRRLETPWSKKEITAYQELGNIPPEDIEAVERYYAVNWPPKAGLNILRHDMLTFLNNFNGEVDRAKNSIEPKKSTVRMV